ncbi:MAG: alginate lyase family protein [Candidatus Euphemobacter frigidus]|nr:alginate lyase family protein [Candidatus Euphemobacter frigidus]
MASFLTDPKLAEPGRYLKHRRIATSDFFFSPEDRVTARSQLFRFDGMGEEGSAAHCVVEADTILKGVFRYFSHHEVEAGFPPDWFANPFQKTAGFDLELQAQHWSVIDDFSRGDIKVVWELSRFSFVYPLIRAYWRTGDDKYAEGFWRLVEDWRECNPPRCGPQWKCGQEVAFRIMAWVFGLYGSFDAPATTAERLINLAQMIAVSAERIESNLSYALSQKNNHPISEAMGLWTAGIIFPEFNDAARWKERGREILERCALELIYPDGTFSQHSTNYHRLMLDDYLWVLSLAEKNGEKFSEPVMDRVKAAGLFLLEIIDPDTGRVPNLGANDGALILPLTNCNYLDFRPTVQAALILTAGKRAFTPGPWDEALFWLGLPALEDVKPTGKALRVNSYFKDGGYLILRGKISRAMIRCTSKYRHRPSHADQLHLDLWRGSTNILRDSGTYSYNDPPWETYFSSTGAHNTAEFDGHNQMPRLSRFLFGDWLAVRTTEPLTETKERIRWEGGHLDWSSCVHRRRVEVDLLDDVWTITDFLSGFRTKAVLHWRLASELTWRLEGLRCIADGVIIKILPDCETARIELVQGWESLYYFEKVRIPVLEITLQPSYATVTTTIKFDHENKS